jgi:hypothetical protein
VTEAGRPGEGCLMGGNARKIAALTSLALLFLALSSC